jgi:hypothetical protein
VKPKSRLVGRIYRIVTPVEALRLNEDICTLQQIKKLLDWIDPQNVADEAQEGRKHIRWARATVDKCLRYATDKLRQEFLTEDRLLQTKIERRRRRAV